MQDRAFAEHQQAMRRLPHPAPLAGARRVAWATLGPWWRILDHNASLAASARAARDERSPCFRPAHEL
ncbi:MAG: hypothetical protein N3F11_00440 [Casimicrobiaceae bacterium]|nr:hypothetical protein [Casimicrobiaceae bacterium]MDW8311196.1 hypothetical protein [Burkholderiales bacterium]